MVDVLKSYLKNNPSEIFISDQSEPHPVLDELINSGLISKISFAKQSCFTLEYQDQTLKILYENQKPIFVDFNDPKIKSQTLKTNRKNLLCKALGLKTNQQHLIDLTAGFGKDSFIVAKYFAKVTWIEQNPIVYLLLKDGLDRYLNSNPNEAQKFELHFSEASAYLNAMTVNDEAVLYFDFMFFDKKAKSNKEMFFLKHITRNDKMTDLDEAIDKAVKNKPIRTVLKVKNYSGGITPKQIYAGPTIKYLVFK